MYRRYAAHRLHVVKHVQHGIRKLHARPLNKQHDYQSAQSVANTASALHCANTVCEISAIMVFSGDEKVVAEERPSESTVYKLHA